jgi:hypothetical protein
MSLNRSCCGCVVLGGDACVALANREMMQDGDACVALNEGALQPPIGDRTLAVILSEAKNLSCDSLDPEVRIPGHFPQIAVGVLKIA